VGLSEQLDVWVGENLAYFTGTGGLTIVDVSDPTNLSTTDNYNPPGEPGVKFFNAAVDEVNDYAYCAAREDGLFVISTSDSTDIQPVFHETYGSAFLEGLSVGDGVLYGAMHGDGIFVYDLSAPGSPVVVDTVAVGIEDAWRLTIRGNHLFVADGGGGIKVLDLSNPLSPIVVHSVATTGDARELALIDDLLVVAAGSAGMDILDVSDPTAAFLVGTYESDNAVFDVSGHDGVAAAATWNLVEIVDLSNPAFPEMAGWEDTPGRVMGVFMAPSVVSLANNLPGPVVYVADWSRVRTYEYGPPYDADIHAFPGLIQTPPVQEGTVIDSAYTAINTGGVTVDVSQITVSGSHPGAFEILTPIPFSVASGDSAEILVRFTAPADSSVNGLLFVFSNDPDEGTFRLQWNMGDARLEVGDPAFDFTLTGLDGLPHSLSDHLGSVVILAFFATW